MGTAHSPFTVDVIDDDDDVLGSLRFLLETEGFRVRTFTSGVPLLARDMRDQAHCLVIDYKMPDMTGLELASLLNQRGIFIPIVLITASPDASIPIRAADCGIRHVLIKPHLDDSLVAHVRTAIDETQQRHR